MDRGRLSFISGAANGAAHSLLWFRRGLRGELRLPLATLVLAAAASSAVAVLSGQLDRSMLAAANGALGADLVVRASNPLPPTLARLAAALGLATTTSVNFATVAVAGERMKLASVSAVGFPWPLRGTLRLRTSASKPAAAATGIPSPGTVWAAPALAAALNLRVGETLELGRRKFRLGALVVRAPGASLDLANIAPALLMNARDLAATGLAGPQSRADYQLLLAGGTAQLATFRQRARPMLPAGAELRDASDSTPGLSTPLDGTRDFLRLALLATLLVAAAALIQSARHYVAREEKTVAVLQTLGASRARLRRLYGFELLWLALAATGLGALCGWGLARGFAALASHWFHLALAPAPLASLTVAPATVAILAAGLWWVPTWLLPNTRPLLLLRRTAPPKRNAAITVLAAAVAIAGLVAWRGASSWTLTLWTLAAAAALAAIVAVLAYAFVRALGAGSASIRPAWRYAATQLARRPARSLVELVAFGLVITVILLLTGVRHDLIANWRAQLPADAPDHFVVNIQATQRFAVQRFFRAEGIAATPLYPMVRARLVAIDGTSVAAWKNRLDDAHAQELLLREQTLSMRAEPGAGNKVTAGRWWKAGDTGRRLVSVDEDWAKSLHVRLGDRLSFSVADRRLTLVVASLRTIHWQSFRPNFFLVTPPGTLANYPATWIGAFRASANDRVALSLQRRFPNLTVIDVGAIIAAVTDLLRHAALALAAVFALALVAAALVLLAALEAGRRERTRDLALLRTLGARRGLLAATLGAEFVTLGAIAGLTAGVVAAGAGWALARWVFELPARFDGWLLLAGALGGILVIGGIGLAATLRLARIPPLVALRRD